MNVRKFNYSTVCRGTIQLVLLLLSGFLFGCTDKKQSQQVFSTQNEIAVTETTIDVNTCSANDLETIPHVGEKLAQKILEHRQIYGKFRKVEHLLLVEGISDRRFREIKSLVKVE